MNHAQFWGGGGAAPYEIEQSLRFERTDSAHLRRTFGTPTTQNVYTYSTWLKYIGWGTDTFTRSNYKDQWLLSPYQDNSNWGALQVNNDLKFVNYTSDAQSRGTDGGIVSDMVVRDPSAWYHVIFVLDATQSALSDRMEIYVNGVKQIVTSTGNPVGQNQTTILNKASTVHDIGRNERIGQLDSNARYFSMMLAETHFIDGQALSATDFGEFDDNGVWRPIEYTGTYGNNGFYLTYDPSATNGIGHDHSGNGNNWTPSGFTTSGTGTDVMSDTPTTNYATINAVVNYGATPSFTDGNLYYQSQSSGQNNAVSTIALGVTGKYYWEIYPNGNASVPYKWGLMSTDSPEYDKFEQATQAIMLAGDTGAYRISNASFTSLTSWSGSHIGASDKIGMAYDADTGIVSFYRNGTFVQSWNMSSYFSGKRMMPFMGFAAGSGYTNMFVNYGQQPFHHTPPSGYEPVSTSKLPEVDITNPSEHFNTVLYTGNGTTKSVSGVGFSPDFVWIKDRSSSTQGHFLFDRVRGTTKYLRSDNSGSETTDTNSLTSFDSDGFTLGSNGGINNNNNPTVAWCWKAGGAPVTNNVGSISAQVSANPTAGFSIVKWTGTGANGSVGHGLGVAPKMLFVKDTSNGYNWYVFTTATGSNLRFEGLNNSAGSTSQPSQYTASSTVISNVTQFASLNTSGATMLVYCFAEVEGYSKIGRYKGNGSSNGPFVNCGFKPAFLLIKRSDSSGDWFIFDTARDTYNVSYKWLKPNNTGSEPTGGGDLWDILSNGFKARNANGNQNASGGTYIYMAFAEHPFGGDGVSPATAR